MIADVPPLPKKKKPFLGHSVKNGKIRFLSVSQIVQADPQSDGGCMRRWAFVKVFGNKEPQSEAQRKGSEEYAKSLETYLTTGEDVLVPVLRPAKHLFPKPGNDLECEKELALDIEQAIRLRELFLSVSTTQQRAAVAEQLQSVALLTANHIPFVGAADFRHRRGEYADDSGTLRKEDSAMRVVEIGDLKTTSRINNYTSSSGKFYQGWGKTTDQILAHPQMVGYGKHAFALYPDTTHVRLGHVICQTKNGYSAVKRHGLVDREFIERKWQSRVVSLVTEMEDVAATATRPADVPANLSACDAFRGCPHAAYCDRPERTITDLLPISKGDRPMSSAGLFDLPSNNNNGTACPPLFPTVPPLPMSEADRAAVIAAERARLETEDAKRQHPLEGLQGYKVGQACNGQGWYQSNDGAGHIPVEKDHKCVKCATLATHIGSINPPDAPRPDPVEQAAPISPEVAATIQDPTLKAKVQAHADAHTARTAETTDTDTKKKTGGRCVASGQTITPSPKEVRSAKRACSDCGKDVKLELSEDCASATVVSHNRPKTDTAPSAPPASVAAISVKVEGDDGVMRPLDLSVPPLPIPPPPATAPFTTTGLQTAMSTPPLPPILPTARASAYDGITLFVDMVFDKGEMPVSLDPYINDLVAAIQERAGVPDIRYVPDNHELGYGRWRGALAACVRFDPPKPGVYVAYVNRSGIASETAAVVVEALLPLCKVVARGIR